MRCATIIVNYHCAADTLAAVASVIEESPQGEILVTDNSACAEEAQKLTQHLPAGVRLIVNERNVGFGAGCNRALQECSDDYVLLLNPDARLLPGALEILCAALETHATLGAVAPAAWWDDERQWLLPTLLPETALQWLLGALCRRWPETVGRRLALRWLGWQQQLHAGNGPQPANFLSGAALLVRRSAVEAAGGLFDERFFMFYEDADLSRRLRAAGFRLALVPEAQAVHRWRNSASKAGLMSESSARYLAKHYPVLSRIALLPRLTTTGLFAAFGLRPHRPGAWGVAARLSPPLTSSIDWLRWLGNARLICISPSPSGFPAIFRPGGAAQLAATENMWSALASGHYTVLADVAGKQEWLAFEKASA